MASDKFQSPKWLQCRMLQKGVEMVHEWTSLVTRGNVYEANIALYVRYIRTTIIIIIMNIPLSRVIKRS